MTLEIMLLKLFRKKRKYYNSMFQIKKKKNVKKLEVKQMKFVNNFLKCYKKQVKN